MIQNFSVIRFANQATHSLLNQIRSFRRQSVEYQLKNCNMHTNKNPHGYNIKSMKDTIEDNCTSVTYTHV